MFDFSNLKQRLLCCFHIIVLIVLVLYVVSHVSVTKVTSDLRKKNIYSEMFNFGFRKSTCQSYRAEVPAVICGRCVFICTDFFSPF